MTLPGDRWRKFCLNVQMVAFCALVSVCFGVGLGVGIMLVQAIFR